MKYTLIVFLFCINSSIAFGQSQQIEPIVDSLTVEELDSNQTDSMAVVVYVSFVVTKEGEITRVKVQKTICDSCLKTQYCDKKHIKSLKKEAVRVVKKMGTWKPAIIEGEAVNTSFIMPIRFVE